MGNYFTKIVDIPYDNYTALLSVSKISYGRSPSRSLAPVKLLDEGVMGIFADYKGTIKINRSPVRSTSRMISQIPNANKLSIR